MKYTPHHTAISVRDLQKTLEFYKVFGFREVHRYNDPDKIGVKLKLDDYVLELFVFKDNFSKPELDLALGNNLADLGVKHIGFTVTDVDAALTDLKSKGLANDDTQMLTKDTARFFFVKDPDGMWVEVIKDNRY